MMALLALIPLKDKLYAAGIAVLLALGTVAWFHHDHALEQKGAAKEAAAVQKESARVTVAAEKHVKELKDQHAAEVAKVKTDAQAQHDSDAAQHVADLQRMQQLDAYRRSHPDAAVRGAESGPGDSGAGAGSAGQSEDRVERLERISAGLADATRDLISAVTSCARERNDLAGK